ncbi:hypothetical protein FBU30_001551, partial [Linnemannia zychae]
DFRPVGFTIEKILSARLSMSSTVLHIDGRRSAEKELAHRKRDQALSKRLETLERDHAEGKLLATRQLYKRIKASYRAPPEATVAVLEVLGQCDWNICQCRNQSETCIAQIINNAVDPDHIRIITKDFDLMAFESTTSITMPIKKVWTTFRKSKLLENHDFLTPSHLTLALR